MAERQLTIFGGSNREFVRRLSEMGTRFFVFGGTAVHFYSTKRQPDDLDLMVAPFPETLQKVNQALIAVGDSPVLATPEEFAQPGKMFSKKNPSSGAGLYLDVLTPPRGMDFDEHWAQAEQAYLAPSAIPVRILRRETLQVLLRRTYEEATARARKCEADLRLLDEVEQAGE